MTIFTDFPAASMAEGQNFSFAIDFKMHSAFHAMFLHLPWTTIFCRNYPLNHHSSKDRKRRANRCKRKAKGYQKDKTCDFLSLCHPFAFRLLSFCDPFVILSGFVVASDNVLFKRFHFLCRSVARLTGPHGC